MDSRFLNAFLTPGRTYIEGYALKPFCLKHRIWLMGIGSPFMAEDKPIEVPDLIVALRICSEGNMDRLTFRERWVGWRLALDKDRFKRACQSLVAHMDWVETWPRFWQNKNAESGVDSTPWALSLLANLIKNGVSYQEALEMPEPRAVWLSSAFSISAGAKLEFLSPEMEAEIDAFLSGQQSMKPHA